MLKFSLMQPPLHLILAMTVNFLVVRASPQVDEQAFSSKEADDRAYNPVKRKVLVPDLPRFVAIDEDASADTFRVRRVNEQDRRAAEGELDPVRAGMLDRRVERLYKRELQRRDDGYGIVYGNGRPIGILEVAPAKRSLHDLLLQPFPQAYELKPVAQEEEALQSYPRRSAMDMYAMDKRASQDRDAKKFNKKEAEKTDVKRKAITSGKIAELKSALDRIHGAGGERVEEIEDSIRDILADMNLVDADDTLKSKRSSGAEDENLEEGPNKIEIVKASRDLNLERSKREEKKEDKKEEKPREDKADTSKTDNGMNNEDAKTINVANYQAEGEAYIRSKRQEDLKALEKSGDLTVSGNKSPLSSSEAVDKRNTEQTTSAEKVKREQDESELEKSIQAKIDAIKEQVKREIDLLKAKSADESRRKKRDVNTLLAEETSALDPSKHNEEILVPHVRRRRHLEDGPKRAKRSASDLPGQGEGDYADFEDKQRPERESMEYEEQDEPERRKEDDAADAEKKSERQTTSTEVSATDTSTQPTSTASAVSENENTKLAKVVEEVTRQSLGASSSDATAQIDPMRVGRSNSVHRRRRQVEEEQQAAPSFPYYRQKRANAVVPYAKSFYPYREEEESEEGDEFEDENFEDRLQKRDAGYNYAARPSMDYPQDYAFPDAYNFRPEVKRSLARNYVARENSDVYENPNYLYHPYVRRKRQDFEQMANFHGGGPMLHHLAAIRERNMRMAEENERNKRNFKSSQAGSPNFKEEPENIADLSSSDLFGALPQSYDGSNLLRFKRVKRRVQKEEAAVTAPTTPEPSESPTVVK